MSDNPVNAFMSFLAETGVTQLTTEDLELDGRTLTLSGESLINFGSCSYLGLDTHPALVEGTIDATRRFGTQFSSSRAYLSVTPYSELESMLETLYDAPVVVTPSTTLGHFAAFSVMVGPKDAVILDQQVHASVQTAAQTLAAQGIPVSIIRHNDMNKLEARLKELSGKHDKVWYFADGIYSMYGDYAPFEELRRLLDTYPELHLYIDDAHGNSWCGDHGVGAAWAALPHEPRMVLAVSLNKTYAAAGGAVIVPNRELAHAMRNLGSTLVFSGPIQPPMLGAAVASAKLHLDGALEDRQLHLAKLIARLNAQLAARGLPQAVETDSPIFFVPVGSSEAVMDLNVLLREDGYFCNLAIYPAVSKKRGGLRFMPNANLSLEDADGLVEAIARHYPSVLKKHGHTGADIARLFGIEVPGILAEAERAAS